MIKHIFFLLSIIFGVTIISCHQKLSYETPSNLWLGGYRLLDPLDQNSAIPLKNHAFMVNDTTIFPIVDGVTKEDDKILKSKTAFEVSGKTLNVQNSYFFYNMVDNPSAAKNLSVDGCWENNNYHFCFRDSVVMIYNKLKKQTIYKCYSLEDINGNKVLNLYGNKWDCNPKLQYFKLQVLQQKPKDLLVRGFLDGDFKEESLKVTKKVIKEENDFQVCDDLIFSNHPKYRYYGPGTHYIGGIYHIEKIFKQKYVVPKDIIESGLIRIRFVVNCKGETGRFEVLETDTAYVEKKFHLDLSGQILSICQGLDQWIPGKLGEQNVDSYKFLTFKILNNEIIEIFP